MYWPNPWRTHFCVQRTHSCVRDMFHCFFARFPLGSRETPKTVKHPVYSDFPKRLS
jgi:hypothetical protein